MKKKHIYCALSLLLFVINPLLAQHQENSASQNQEAEDPPNIIVIIPDDLGWSDVGYHGSEISTPNIDRLAASSIRFDHQYVYPTCTPTRVSFITGRYPSRFGVTGPDYGEVIDMGTPTLPSLLQENGYHTAIAGKWHMGSPPYTPLKYGFDASYGFFDGQIDPYTHEYKTETATTRRRSWHRNDEYLDEEGHATDLITEEAIRVINEKRANPFFLYVAYSVPHHPLNEPREWTSQYEHLTMSPSRKWFAASVTHMDDGIGKIVDALNETGQRENTIILFISDNGGQKSWHSDTLYHGAYSDKPHTVLGNNYPLKGWKQDLYEGGIRVPAFINWKGTLESGTAEMPVHVSDWLPTFYGAAGIDRDLSALQLDGQNIWPYLTDQQPVNTDRRMYWKVPHQSAVREGAWKLIEDHDTGGFELYNLDNDFRETHDLSEEYPEKVEQLTELLEKFEENDRQE
ncbi:sulfatase-like hydrolase/transferase [Aliifodinibius sp. S!AR15-10]|uniref:sulfatase-like hydrolase/transferase n=1 Tax=Aliifodinibius sp. S!AR15-10 TaxID=2950437 RepID=UPI002859F344|nr:sulfatase-like hydrolase/transferase [Aliifodinibius sp. S!AR15-10]MDR8393020.1 sulfatase-like hydrolase/transferase [Aliifodinibius sp. S!AR15-10]